MIGIDTNVLVRFLIKDDETQLYTAREFFNSLTEENQGYLTLVTVVELVWVLTRIYKQSRLRIAAFLDDLFEVESIAFQDSEAIYQALISYKNGTDFSDALIKTLSRGAGCSTVVTFDKKAAKSLGMQLLV